MVVQGRKLDPKDVEFVRRLLAQNPSWGRRNCSLLPVPHETDAIRCALSALLPVQVNRVSPHAQEHGLFRWLLSQYHYLGHRNTVGENMRYLVRDQAGRPLACLLFGSAAWKAVARDGEAPAAVDSLVTILASPAVIMS